MQLLQRASFSSPTINPLVFFCGCCALVHLIRSAYITRDESSAHHGDGVIFGLWIVTRSIAGGTGSCSLLLTFLCIKFQDTNSMSVPRGNFKKLHSLFKQESLKKAATSSKDKKQRRKTGSRKGKKQDKYKPLREKNDNDKLKKSKDNFLADTSTTGVFSTISSADHVGFKNQVNPHFSPTTTQHSKLLSSGQKDNLHAPHFSTDTGDKRKPVRRGKNANEFPASNPLRSSAGSSLMGNLFMSQNEEEVLRRKILARVDELDPLLCLPKVLCGYSSRRHHKTYSRLKTTTTTTSTTHRPTDNEGIIDEYLQLLGIVPPIPEEEVEDDLKEADMYLKSKKHVKKSSKERKKVKSKKKKKKKRHESEEDYRHQDRSGSGSSSNESNESGQRERYPYRSRPYYGKFLFKRTKDSAENDIGDDDDDDSALNDDEEEVDDLLDDEEIKYVLERKKMEKLMTSGSHSDENWWDPFTPYYPPFPLATDDFSPYDPLATDDLISDGGITGWFSNMFSNIMPRLSWGGLKDKDDFAIKNDPFFSSFDGRSMTNRESRSFPTHNSSAKLPSSSKTPKKLGKTGKQLNLEQYFGVRINSKQLDYARGDNRDPAEKYRTAVEIGTRVTNPVQCDFVYNGCPLSYEEILAIINEPLKKKPNYTRKKPLRTSPTTPPTFSKATSSFTHNFITPPPRQIVVPLHQQQQLPYQPPQALVLHQQQPQYQILHPQQSYQQQPPLQLYNQHQQFQQQLAHPPHYILHNPQMLHQSAQLHSYDGIVTQVGKRSNKPHKTKIHQALPSGEIEINLQYQADANMGKSYLPQGGKAAESDNSNYAQETETDEDTPHLYNSGVMSVSNSYEHSQQTDPFNHKLLSYKNYEFSPSKGYKIRRKDSDMEKSATSSKDVKVVSNAIKIGSSSGSSLSASEENNNNVEVVSPPVPEKSTGTDIKKRHQRNPTPVTYKSKGKYQRKQLFKSTSSSAPPLRHSSNHHHRTQPQQQQVLQGERKKKGNGNNSMKIMRRKHGKEKKKRKKKRKGIQNDDNSSGNSSSNNSSGVSSASNEQLQYNKENQSTEYHGEMQKRHRKRLNKKTRRKPHLHKQSSDSIEVKKRVEIGAPNAIYPIYGHPFPPPYAGYYPTLYPSTPTSPSFFSYFFGR